MFKSHSESSFVRGLRRRAFGLSVFSHIAAIAILTPFQVVYVSKVPSRSVTVVETATPNTFTVYTAQSTQKAALDRPRASTLVPSPTAPTPIATVPASPTIPTSIPSEIQGLLENDVPALDLGSLSILSTIPKMEQPALELNPPEPHSDPKASVTPSAEEHLDKPALRIGGRVIRAEPILNQPPVYPEIARRARVEGSVVLNAVVSVQGVLKEIQIVSGHPLLVQAAVDCVRNWRYRPGTLNEQIIEMPITIRVDFALKFR